MWWEPRDPKNPDRLLVPLPHQLEFAMSKAYATLAAGGWASAKSCAILMGLAINLANNPGCKHLFIEPTYQLARDFLNSYLRPSFGHAIVGESAQDNMLVFPHDTKLIWASGHDLKKLEQHDAVSVTGDEVGLMKSNLMLKSIARTRDSRGVRRRVLFAGVPYIGWMSDEFEGRNDDNRRIMHFRTQDNPHNGEGFLEQLYQACPARMRAAFLDGEFVAAGGAVYAEMTREQHIIHWKYRDEVRMEDGSVTRPQINIVIDWSVKRPHVLVVQRVPKGAMMPGGWVTRQEVSVVVDEMYPDGEYQGITVVRLCHMIRDRRPSDRGYEETYAPCWPAEYAVVDPAGLQRKASTVVVNDTEIAQAESYLGIPIQYMTGRRIMPGIQAVQLALAPVAGHPRLFFSDKLLHDWQHKDEPAGNRGVIKAMFGYAHKENTSGRRDSEEPHHDNTYSHAADDVRYHVDFHYPLTMHRAEVWEQGAG